MTTPPPPDAPHTPIAPEALPGGLRLRRATPDDIERVADLSAVHHTNQPGRPDEDIRTHVREMMTSPGPQTSLADWLLIDDPATGEIAAFLVVLSHRWSYGGVTVPVGRVEFVTSTPAHTGRGLVHALMGRYHRLSAARGQPVQVVAGIAHYYRRFGYEYALPQGASRTLRRDRLPPIPDGPPLRFREATQADVPLLLRLTEAGGRRWLVSSDVSAADWRHELAGRHPDSAHRALVLVGEDAGGTPVGAARVLGSLLADALSSDWSEVADGVGWAWFGPHLLRHLDALGERLHADGRHFAIPHQPRAYERLTLGHPDGHPLDTLLADRLEPMRTRPAWYVRAPDVPALLTRVAPALERRLAASPDHAGHTGELRISHYGRGGLTLRFADGRLLAAEPWAGLRTDGVDARFPDLTFLPLLFGHRSLAEQEHAFPDCRALSDDAFSLLDTLFPKAPSWLWPFF